MRLGWRLRTARLGVPRTDRPKQRKLVDRCPSPSWVSFPGRHSASCCAEAWLLEGFASSKSCSKQTSCIRKNRPKCGIRRRPLGSLHLCSRGYQTCPTLGSDGTKTWSYMAMRARPSSICVRGRGYAAAQGPAEAAAVPAPSARSAGLALGFFGLLRKPFAKRPSCRRAPTDGETRVQTRANRGAAMARGSDPSGRPGADASARRCNRARREALEEHITTQHPQRRATTTTERERMVIVPRQTRRMFVECWACVGEIRGTLAGSGPKLVMSGPNPIKIEPNSRDPCWLRLVEIGPNLAELRHMPNSVDLGRNWTESDRNRVKLVSIRATLSRIRPEFGEVRPMPARIRSLFGNSDRLTTDSACIRRDCVGFVPERCLINVA